MARFDEVFAELQAKIGSVIAIIAADHDLAVRVREAIDAAEAEAVVAEEAAQDDARANALKGVITEVGAVLRQVAPLETDTPVEPEPEPEPAPE